MLEIFWDASVDLNDNTLFQIYVHQKVGIHANK